eukprot:scaffold38811_cov63-Phaeocystis_antarctica.AAC.1
MSASARSFIALSLSPAGSVTDLGVLTASSSFSFGHKWRGKGFSLPRHTCPKVPEGSADTAARKTSHCAPLLSRMRDASTAVFFQSIPPTSAGGPYTRPLLFGATEASAAAGSRGRSEHLPPLPPWRKPRVHCASLSHCNGDWAAPGTAAPEPATEPVPALALALAPALAPTPPMAPSMAAASSVWLLRERRGLPVGPLGAWSSESLLPAGSARDDMCGVTGEVGGTIVGGVTSAGGADEDSGVAGGCAATSSTGALAVAAVDASSTAAVDAFAAARLGEPFAVEGVPDVEAILWVDRRAGRPAHAALEHAVLWRRDGAADHLVARRVPHQLARSAVAQAAALEHGLVAVGRLRAERTERLTRQAAN